VCFLYSGVIDWIPVRWQVLPWELLLRLIVLALSGVDCSDSLSWAMADDYWMNKLFRDSSLTSRASYPFRFVSEGAGDEQEVTRKSRDARIGATIGKYLTHTVHSTRSDVNFIRRQELQMGQSIRAMEEIDLDREADE
jgi:hypothetical protein